MTLLSSLAALLLVQALFFILGIGITTRVPALRRNGWAVLLAPLAGHLALILLALRFNVSVTTGGRAALLAAALLAGGSLLAGRALLEALRRFRRPALVRLVLLAAALQGFVASGFLASGFRTYNGYASLDAWYYVTDVALLKDRAYFEAFAPGPLQPHLRTSVVATRVGPEFAVLLVSELGGLDELAAYNLVLASLTVLVPIAVGFLCREALSLPWRWTLAASAASGLHSSLFLVYLNQHLGHLLSLAVMPAGLGGFAAALRRRDPARAVFAALLAVGGMYAYWPTLPLVAGPLALIALGRRVLGRRDGRVLLAFGLTGIALVVAASPEVLTRYVVALSGPRPPVSRNDPVMMAFNPYLTEDLLPLAAGLVEAGSFGAWWHAHAGLAPLRARTLIGIHHAAAVLLVGIAVVGLAREMACRRLVLPVAVGVPLVLLCFVLAQEYGYGAYKLASWGHVPFTVCLVLGVRALWRARRRRLARVTAAVAILGYIGLNAQTAREYVRRSMAGTTARLVIGSNFAGNPDWESLEGWAARHSDGAILVGLHSHVAQYWAAYRLRSGSYAFLVPQDVMGGVTVEEQARHDLLKEVPDERPPVALDPAAVGSAAYFLDWAKPNDVPVNDRMGPPVERNGTFALYPLAGVSRFLSLRQGWHAFENSDPATGRPVRFRWMSPRASVLLYRFPAEPVHLLLAARAGIGLPTLDRRVTLLHRGLPVGSFAFAGMARVLTPAFTPSVPLDELEVRVDGEPKPLPRPLTLWNRWVQHDPRALSLGVYEIRACARTDEALPADGLHRRYTPDEVRTRLLYEGIHADDWLAGGFTLRLPSSVRTVRIGVAVHRLGPEPTPIGGRVTLDGRLLRPLGFQAFGDAELELELPPGPADAMGLRALSLEFDRPLMVPTRDAEDVDLRQISCRLRWLELR